MENFDALSANAYDPYTGEPGSKEHLDKLWRSLFLLEYWNFLIHPDAPMKPHVEEHDGKSWVLVFTDNTKLNDYARLHHYTNDDNKVLSMSVPASAALDWLVKGNAGVFGVRFNEGDYGWYAPIEVLPAIYSHLFSSNN
ncbi:MAG: hypothetical protein MUF42_09530 [Cytophagaceae bacterium]|jgi:hypothetical protein|nr:hypothetical protein [Cytophagaceae bacterium]